LQDASEVKHPKFIYPTDGVLLLANKKQPPHTLYFKVLFISLSRK
jgi:hypothetical protein